MFLYLSPQIMNQIAAVLLLVSLSMANALFGGVPVMGGFHGVGGHTTTVMQHRQHLPVVAPVMKGFGGYGLGVGGYGLGGFGGYGIGGGYGGYGLGGFGGYGLGGGIGLGYGGFGHY